MKKQYLITITLVLGLSLAAQTNDVLFIKLKDNTTRSISVNCVQELGFQISNNDLSYPIAEAIDLGLPSGTKWASWNVGASAPEECGEYYSWGETEVKDNHSWGNYIYSRRNTSTLYDIGDDIVGTEYDVAHTKWWGLWHMPTVDQIDELIDNCKIKWKEKNGVKGILVTGPNGATIFLPAVGYLYYKGYSDLTKDYELAGYYWSSSFRGASFYFDSKTSRVSGNNNCEGLPVRPVYSPIPIPLTLSQKDVKMRIEESKKIVITNGSGNYSVISDNKKVAKATLSGKTITINALAIGTTTIIVEDLDSNQKSDILVQIINKKDHNCPVAEAIDLGLPSGTKWASWNVGATKPEEYGDYYAWGETEEKWDYTFTPYTLRNNSEITFIGYDIAGTEYDVAHVKWGGSWKMPTVNQIEELLDSWYCTRNWSTRNGVYGLLVTGRNGKSIFLPAAGGFMLGDHMYSGEGGLYWTSSLQSYCSEAYILKFINIVQLSDEWRPYGLSVRPVCK